MEYNYIYDLDDKINLIYDYLYNINTKNCFIVDKIEPSHINLDDVKLRLDYDNKEDITFYEKTKNEILSPGQYRFISYDKDLLCLFFKKYTNQFSINFKINFYKYEEKINNLSSEPNNDSLFEYLLSYLVLSKLTKHILLPIVNLDCSFDDLEPIVKDIVEYNEIKKLILNNIISDTVCVQLRESFFKNVDLEEYLKENRCHLKILLFQIFHTLAVLQENHKGFSHNNLTLKNILIYLKKKSSFYSYYDGFKNDKFYVYNNGFDIKITNFEKAYIPKLYGNKDNVKNDIITILHDILTKFKNYCDKETETFINFIYPPSLKKSDISKISISAKDLLYNKYFQSFLERPDITIAEETINNHQYITSKINNSSSKSYKLLETYMDSEHNSVFGYQHKMNKVITEIRIIKPYTNINDIIMLKRSSIMIKQKGGVHPTIMKTVQDKNTPFMTNEQKRINEKENQSQDKPLDKSPFKTQDKPVNYPDKNPNKPLYKNPYPQNTNPYQQDTNPYPQNTNHYQQDKNPYPQDTNPYQQDKNPYLQDKQSYKKKYDDYTYQATTLQSYNPNNRVFSSYYPYVETINQPNINKTYHLHFSNPIGSYTTLKKVYEDILPGDVMTFSMTTVYERMQTLNYLRCNLIEKHDGEYINMKGSSDSLLSYIKIMDINPYSLHNNKYYDLPFNFLLYRAAYPVKLDEKNREIHIAKSSMGLNIRIYMLSHADLNHLQIEGLDKEYSDVWREIRYYEWVKDKLLKWKISPNFIAPILYKIDPKTKLNWNEISLSKKKTPAADVKINIYKNQQKINYKHKLYKNFGFLSELLPLQYKKQMIQHNILNSNDNKSDLSTNSGQILILLTESPTHNIIRWATPVYDSYGTVRKMIATGYHSSDVWYSILFQLVYSFAVLHKAGVYIENFKLEHNVYIKDIYTDLNNVGSWIYTIHNIDFYVPNYGYILMIDTKFSDIEFESSLTKKPEDKEKKFKIYSHELYDHNNNMSNDDIQKKIYKQFKETINPDNFRYYFKEKGGRIPDSEIIDLLDKIYKLDETIVDILATYFSRFYHNRVGTLLYKSEIENINKTGTSINYDKYHGKLMIYEQSTNEYRWVIYLDEDNSNPAAPQKNFITKVGNIFTRMQTQKLYAYSDTERILPENKKNLKYDDLHIYETYNYNNLFPLNN